MSLIIFGICIVVIVFFTGIYTIIKQKRSPKKSHDSEPCVSSYPYYLYQYPVNQIDNPTSNIVDEPYPFTDKKKQELISRLPSDDDDIVVLSDDDYECMLYATETYKNMEQYAQYQDIF